MVAQHDDERFPGLNEPMEIDKHKKNRSAVADLFSKQIS